MSGMILCRSEYSKKPYYIAGVAINVHSLEEICYFLYQNIYLVGIDFFCEDLFTYIEKDIKEPELAKKLRFLSDEKAGLSELILTVLRYVDFYTDEEVNRLSEVIDKLDTQNVLERLKSRADNYLANGRYNSAITNYEDIIYGDKDETLDDKFYAKVWHNMGVAYARMMMFNFATICFKRALEINNNDETRKCYFTALMFENGRYEQEESDSDDIMDETRELMYVASRELETYMDGAVGSIEYQPVSNVLVAKKEGKISEYYSGVEKLIKSWRDDYLNNTK